MREELESERLLLRPPREDDIKALVVLANNYAVTKNTISMPFPYGIGDARSFLRRAKEGRALGKEYQFSIIRKSDLAFIGSIGVQPEREFEMGYWIGEPFWGQGYATEAARRVARFAFEELRATKISASWYDDNPASGRVLEKLGFRHEKDELRTSLSRRCAATCRFMTLTRAAFARMQAAS
ncbi:MAG: GNAT family N-acetyltransferase [Alphaproteobacteria bacterium]